LSAFNQSFGTQKKRDFEAFKGLESLS